MPSNQQKFNILYCGDAYEDAISLCEYIDEFYHAAGLKTADFYFAKLVGVIAAMSGSFPTPYGSENSSPFKKVAAFTTFFAAEKPILTPLPEDQFLGLHNQQSAII